MLCSLIDNTEFKKVFTNARKPFICVTYCYYKLVLGTLFSGLLETCQCVKLCLFCGL